MVVVLLCGRVNATPKNETVACRDVILRPPRTVPCLREPSLCTTVHRTCGTCHKSTYGICCPGLPRGPEGLRPGLEGLMMPGISLAVHLLHPPHLSGESVQDTNLGW